MTAGNQNVSPEIQTPVVDPPTEGSATALRRSGARRYSRRVFLRLSGMVAASTALAACASGAVKSVPHGRETGELVYQDWRTDWFSSLALEMLAEFNAEHPSIHVFYTPDPNNLDEKMVDDFQAGTAPDVLQGCCDFMPAWGQQGYLLDLRPYVAADLDRATINDWDRAQYQALFTREGVQFALPKYHGALALYYNKDMFDRAGVDYPDAAWTHDDYLAAMRDLVKALSAERSVWGSMVDVSWDRLQIHVNGWGGHLVDPADPTRSLMAQGEALGAWQWIRDRMWGDHTMASPLDVQNLETRHAFIQQRLAMVEDGSWALKDILANASFRIGVAPFPSGPVRKVTLATTDGFAIYAGTRYPEAAWELLKFLIGHRYAQAMARAHLLQPARASLVDEWIGFIREQYPAKAQDMDIGAFADGHLKGYSVTAEVFSNMAEARRLAHLAWEQIFTLGRAPVSLMQDVSAQIEEAQRPAT